MTHRYFQDQPSTDSIRAAVDELGVWLEIDLDAISFNLSQIRARVGPDVEVMPVMKNDAYGHGLVPMVAHLSDQGCERVMVAKLSEAFALRRAVPECDVVCMDALHTPQHFEHTVERGVIPVIYDLDVAGRLADVGRQLGTPARVFVKIDTGLRRVGVAHEQAPALIDAIRGMDGIEVLAVMSTFMQHPDHDAAILERFLKSCEAAGISGRDDVLRSLASTNGILHMPNSALEIVRPAMCLLGVHPFDGDDQSGLALEQALRLCARIEMVKDIARGESVSYFGSFVAPKPMRVGTIHAGFYDGIPREVANRAIYRCQGVDCATLGSISLNHTLVDLTDTDAQSGDVVTIIGRDGECALKPFADRAGWMVYSVLNHLNPLTPRVYFKNAAPVALLDRSAELYGV